MAEWVEPAVSPMSVAGAPAFAACFLGKMRGGQCVLKVEFGLNTVISGQVFCSRIKRTFPGLYGPEDLG
jgi:hypothetical protein